MKTHYRIKPINCVCLSLYSEQNSFLTGSLLLTMSSTEWCNQWLS